MEIPNNFEKIKKNQKNIQNTEKKIMKNKT